MRFVPTEIADCMVVEMNRHFDDRGFFQEIYEEEKYSEIITQPDQRWQQANLSASQNNVLRGIHHAEYAKLVTCVSGKIWDLVVDLRSHSSTYLKYIGVELSSDEPKQIYVPPGCGHGFVALADSTVIYFASGRFSQQGELTVMYNESNLNIPWPGKDHIISERDRGGISLRDFHINT